MKIGIVTEYYYPTLGGIQEHVYHFALEVLKRGHEVKIITSNVKFFPDNTKNGFKQLPVTRVGLRVPIYSNGSVARVTLAPGIDRKLRKIFEEEKFDMLHVHAPLTPTLPILSIKCSNTKTVGTLHTNFNGSKLIKLFQDKLQTYFQQMDGMIGVSKTAVKAAQRYFEFEHKIIPNGIDTDKFNPERKRLSEFDDGRFNLLWIGRIEPRNGLDHMIRSFILASEKKKDLRLIVVGDGPLRGICESMVPTSLKDKVCFLGFVNSQRPEIYSSSDVLCVPASISSFGITLLEGMASGIPVIASDIDGFNDVMTNGKEGMLIDTTNHEIFMETILKLTSNRELAAEYGKNGRVTALNYSWPRIADQIFEYYQNILKK